MAKDGLGARHALSAAGQVMLTGQINLLSLLGCFDASLDELFEALVVDV
jgi:hypothetical protein